MLSNATLATIQDSLLFAQAGLIMIFVGGMFSDQLPGLWRLLPWLPMRYGSRC